MDDVGPIPIYVVERHEIIREALSLLIHSDARFEVAGAFSTCRDAIDSGAGAARVALVTYDPEDTETAAIAELAGIIRVLLLGKTAEPAAQIQAVRLGATGLVTTDQPVEVLLKALVKIDGGEAWFDRSTIAALIAGHGAVEADLAAPIADAAATGLTKREREVVAYIAEGLKNKEIAERLFISEATVRHHLTSVFGKLGVSDRLELLVFMYRSGLAKPKF